MAKKVKYLSLVIAFSMLLSISVFPKKSMSVDFEDISAAGIGAVDIDENGVGTVYGKLNLLETDKNGRTIVWSTEDEDIVDVNTGKILKYRVDGVIETSVTATIDGESETVNFKVGYVHSPDNEPLFPSDSSSGGVEDFTASKGSVSVLNGVLTATDDNAGNDKPVEFSSSFTQTTTDPAIIEFDVSADDSIGILDLRIENDNCPDAQVRFNIDFAANEVSGRGKGGSGGRDIVYDKPFRDDTASVKVLMNYAENKYDLWINDVIYMSGWSFYSGWDFDSSNRITINAGGDAGRTGEVTLTNFKVYSVSNKPLSDITLARVNGSDSNIVTEDLELPAVDESGNIIEWVSENPNITVDGEWGIVDQTDSEVSGIVRASVVIGDATFIKEFNLTVPKYVRVFSSAPQPEKDSDGKEIVEYYENFDDITIEDLERDGYFASEDLSNGDVYIDKGMLIIDDRAEHHHRYNIGSATKNIDDRMVVEFEAVRTSAQYRGFRCLLIGDSTLLDNAYVHTILSDGIVEAVFPTGTQIVKNDYTKIGRPSKIAIMVCKDSTFSMWVDGERIVDRKVNQREIKSLSSVLAVNLRSTYDMGMIKIDNLKVYKAAVSDVEMVEDIIASMDKESTVIKKNEKGEITAFEYTGANEHNCTITYSSEKGLVEEDGKITFPLDDAEDTVTVTVTSPDGYSESKSFDVTIKANYVLGEMEHDIKTLGFMKGDNIFIIPASSRGNEPFGGVSVKAEVFDENRDVICAETQGAQFLYDDADCFVGVIELTQAQADTAKKVKISLFATQTDEKLKGGEFEIIGG